MAAPRTPKGGTFGPGREGHRPVPMTYAEIRLVLASLTGVEDRATARLLAQKLNAVISGGRRDSAPKVRRENKKVDKYAERDRVLREGSGGPIADATWAEGRGPGTDR